MHPIQSHREYLAQQQELNSLKGGKSFLGRWLGNASRHWERRKMIATLEAMDDRLLRDIGVFRGDIPRLVDGLLCFAESAPKAPSTVQAESSPRRWPLNGAGTSRKKGRKGYE